MRVYRHRSVSKGVLGLGLLAAAFAGGCAEPAAQSGEFELTLDHRAPYAVVGRFHLSHVLGSAPEHEFGFDATTSRLRAQLPAGQYVLTLSPGARLVCPTDGDPEAGSVGVSPDTEGAPLLSTWPQLISITAGGVTTAHIGMGSPPSAAALTPTASAAPGDPVNPCPSATEYGVRRMLSRR